MFEAASGIGLRIKAAAARVGGLNALAAMTGIKRRTLGDYVSGATDVKATALVAICEATAADPRWLLCGDDPPFPQTRHSSGGTMSDHINISHPDSYRRMVEEQGEIAALKARIDVLERANGALSDNLDAIFTRIARGDQVELHYPDGQVVAITKARKRSAGDAA